jgi:hypothetical protein
LAGGSGGDQARQIRTRGDGLKFGRSGGYNHFLPGVNVPHPASGPGYDQRAGVDPDRLLTLSRFKGDHLSTGCGGFSRGRLARGAGPDNHYVTVQVTRRHPRS